MKSIPDVVADFDEIAAAIAGEPRPDLLRRSERFLLTLIPDSARTALDVGCGDGAISRALAARGISALGIDASKRMVDVARSRSGSSPLLDYRVVDILADPVPPSKFDLVISVAMAHHAPLDFVIEYLCGAVAPGGTLLIQDVTTRRGIRNVPINGIAWAARRLELLRGTEKRRPRVNQLYARHGAGEVYLQQSEVARIYRKVLPGARIHHHLGWRYTAEWHN